jgi:hypothetical protein
VLFGGFLSFSQAATPPPPQNAELQGRRDGLHHPSSHIAFASGSSSLFDIPRPGAPVPSPHPPPPPSRFLFWCIFLSVSVFLSFFAVSADLLRAGFIALCPLLCFFRTPTATSFHHALLCMGSTYTRSISFPVFLFACIQLCCFFFSLYFICYLLVIMFWPRWFDWIPFDLDLCVMDVYVTLAFGSRRKNGTDFYVVDKCVSWLNCR